MRDGSAAGRGSEARLVPWRSAEQIYPTGREAAGSRPTKQQSGEENKYDGSAPGTTFPSSKRRQRVAGKDEVELCRLDFATLSRRPRLYCSSTHAYSYTREASVPCCASYNTTKGARRRLPIPEHRDKTIRAPLTR